MRTVLEFNLPEDQFELELVRQARRMYDVLEELAKYLKSITKHMDPKATTADVVRDEFHRMLQENDVEI